MGTGPSLSKSTYAVVTGLATHGEIVHTEFQRAADGQTAAWPDGVADHIIARFTSMGIIQPWKFQAEAIAAVLHGTDVVLTGGTGSGKSLCYQVPVAQIIASTARGTALYLSPTKALAQDQARRLRDLKIKSLAPALYDGDTPPAQRSSIRKTGRVVLTNPDMLSAGILPQHIAWSRFLAHLKLIIIDENHVYRGVFGSHVAQVLRRLQRLCEVYGATPTILCSSATSGAARDHARALTGREHILEVDGVGAPRSARTSMLWNPRLLDPEDSGIDAIDDDGLEGYSVSDSQHSHARRASALTDAASMVSKLMVAGSSTICFTRTQASCELVSSLVKDMLESSGQVELANRVAPYRAGYTQEARRELEQRLVSGDLKAVVATNALELGIDIGSLDAAVSVTYPGSVTSLRQQWGRAGRSGQQATAVMIAGHDALDQFFAADPPSLFGRPVERAVVSTENPRILIPHVLAAACEHPLTDQDLARFSADPDLFFGDLIRNGQLVESPRGLIYAGTDSPAYSINLRSAHRFKYTIVDTGSGEILGDADHDRAVRSLHPGAVYLHQGRRYLVEDLDTKHHIAVVTERPVTFYTQPKLDTEIEVISEHSSRELSCGVEIIWGKVLVREQLMSYRRRRRDSHEVMDTVECVLPPTEFSTEAIWFCPANDRIHDLDPRDSLGALHAAEHALISLLPLYAMCDRADIGGLSTNWHPHTAADTIFIYDGHPGGVGITHIGWASFEAWVQATTTMLRACPCSRGCPSCIQSPKCGNLNEPLHKAGSLALLEILISA